jgi:hypothetical protein
MELETTAEPETTAHIKNSGALFAGIAQLTAAASQLERVAAAIETRLNVDPTEGTVNKLVATVENDPTGRVLELEAKLRTAEARIAEFSAQAGPAAISGRKTIPAAAAHLLAKHGIDTLDQVSAGALDAALTGLSLEQRIAVKSQLLRAGLLT